MRIFKTGVWFLALLILASCGQKKQASKIPVDYFFKNPQTAAFSISPDGEYVVYSWNADGVEPRNLYIVDSSGINPPRMLVQERMQGVREQLPEGVQPFMTPVASLMGQACLIDPDGVYIRVSGPRAT